jgi:hypothetical protein
VHGRWKSQAYRRYFDTQHSLRLRLMATAQLRVRSVLPANNVQQLNHLLASSND